MTALRVVVLGGGRSSEHEVSLASARSIVEGLHSAGHEPVYVEVGRDGVWRRDGRTIALEPWSDVSGLPKIEADRGLGLGYHTLATSMAGAVVNVKLPVEPAGVTVKLASVWLLSLGGPALMALAKLGTVCAAASSSTAGGLFASVNVGASLTKLTVIVKDCVLLLTLGATAEPLSVSVASNVAVPLLSGAGW